MQDCDYDVLIIGGGPAGSTAAILLADAGLNVALIEKKTFPREVLCGEFLSHEVITILSELNLQTEFQNLRPNKINHFSIYDDSGKILSADLEFTAYSLKRSVFDNFLLTAAENHGAKIFPNTEVDDANDLEYGHSVKLKSCSGETKVVTARYLIGAYGKKNKLDKKLNRNFASVKSGYYGIKFHINNALLNHLSANHINIYTSDGIYCGVNVVNDTETTMCYLFRKSKLNSPLSPFEFLLKRNQSFNELLRNSSSPDLSEFKNYGTANIYFGKRDVADNNMIMIGDAAGIIAPLAGDGIGMAMESAKLASGILIDSMMKKTRQEILIEYQMKWKKLFHQRLRNSLKIQNLLFSNSGRRIALSIAENLPFILNKAIRFTRGTNWVQNHS